MPFAGQYAVIDFVTRIIVEQKQRVRCSQHHSGFGIIQNFFQLRSCLLVMHGSQRRSRCDADICFVILERADCRLPRFWVSGQEPQGPDRLGAFVRAVVLQSLTQDSPGFLAGGFSEWPMCSSPGR